MQPMLQFDDSFMTADKSARWKAYPDRGPLPRRTADIEITPVPSHDMLDDRQAKPCPARIPAATGVNPVKPFGQARNMFGCDAGSVVADGQFDGSGRVAHTDRYRITCPPMPNSVFHEISHKLRQLPGVTL